MNHLINTLPIEVINIIISYSYHIQSKELQKDIISYFQTKDIIYNIFYERYNSTIPLNKNAVFTQFIFHIACYLKGTENLYSYDDRLNDFFKRTYMLQNSCKTIIIKYENNMYNNTPNSRFRFYWGLLRPEERDRFIHIHQKMDMNRMP